MAPANDWPAVRYDHTTSTSASPHWCQTPERCVEAVVATVPAQGGRYFFVWDVTQRRVG